MMIKSAMREGNMIEGKDGILLDSIITAGEYIKNNKLKKGQFKEPVLFLI
jgi:hypothetical protein